MSEISKAFAERPFQKRGALFAMKNKNVLIGDQPGLGKTLQSIAAVVGLKLNGSILVVAPKTAVYVTWPAELKRWLEDFAPEDNYTIIGGKQTKLERLRSVRNVVEWDIEYGETNRQWIIVSPNYLRFDIKTDMYGNFVYEKGEKIINPVREAIKPLLYIDWSAIIIDESHQILAGSTGDIKKQSAQCRGMRLLSVKENGLKIALSGTPSRGKPENLWGTLNWLCPKQYSSYWDWIGRYFNYYTDPFGTTQVGRIKSESALAQSLSGVMIRRTKEQVAQDLPPKNYGGTPLFKDGPIAVWIDMDAKQKRMYEDMEMQAMVELEGGTLLANGVLAEMVRLKQFANSCGVLINETEFYPQFPSNKFDWLMEFLTERGIDGKGPGESKVVVASQFTKLINLFAYELREHYKIPCFTLTGKTNEKERVDIQRKFQSNEGPDVFLLNTHAGGVSLTLDSADEVVIIDSTFNPDDQTQVEDRCHRISRIHNVCIWNLASKDSIDESILRRTHKANISLTKIDIELAREMFSRNLKGI